MQPVQRFELPNEAVYSVFKLFDCFPDEY